MSDVQAELPRYKCHKEVHAVKIAAIEILEDGKAKIAPDDRRFAVFTTKDKYPFKSGSDDPGYYVVFSGVYPSIEEAQDAVSKAANSGYENAYARRVTS